MTTHAEIVPLAEIRLRAIENALRQMPAPEAAAALGIGKSSLYLAISKHPRLKAAMRSRTDSRPRPAQATHLNPQRLAADGTVLQ